MKKMFLAALAALGVLAVSCSKENSAGSPDAGPTAAMSVSIKGQTTSSRAVGDPSAEDEKTVHSFSVYVFNNATGILEAEKTFTGSLEGTVNGLGTASQKKVVVFVNRPQGFPKVTEYADFSNPSTMIALADQVPGDFQSRGLFMSGEAAGPVTLSTENVVEVPVTVSRVVAKVKLGSLAVVPGEGLSLDDFKLGGVSIQKARDRYDVLGVNRLSGFSYIGGVQHAGSSEIAVDYLKEEYTLPDSYDSSKLSPMVYFYVFPNDNTNGNATMLSLYGEYKGTQVFFPFLINDQQGSGNSTTDGNWIERNKVYTLNVTLRKIGSGGEDPNIPNEEVSMDVKIDVADWEDELIQDVEW